ncbi:MAG: hypothetical protein VXY33_00905 [Verrucomicrobiota bacterium]|nr:hypothetical protein [Verrucomicrobiota bacterium]
MNFFRNYSILSDDVRQWKDDLWLFPYYTNQAMVPYDSRTGGPAQTAYSSE